LCTKQLVAESNKIQINDATAVMQFTDNKAKMHLLKISKI